MRTIIKNKQKKTCWTANDCRNKTHERACMWGGRGSVGMETECGKDKLRDYKKVAMHIDSPDPVIRLWRNALGALLFPG